MSQKEDAFRSDTNDVASALEAIRASVRRNAGYASAADVPPATTSTAVTELADLAIISAHLPITWSTPVVGQAIALSKRATRLLLRWYINPIVEQQNTFNESLVRTITTIEERLREIERELVRRGIEQ